MQLSGLAWDPAYADMALRLFAALAVGGLIGLERSHHGRPAGFRTHALVCLSTALTFGTLSVFRWIEDQLPARSYARLAVRFAGERVMPEDELRRLLGAHGFKVAGPSYRRDAAAGHFEYRMTIRSNHPERAGELCRALDRLEAVQEYRVSPAGD